MRRSSLGAVAHGIGTVLLVAVIVVILLCLFIVASFVTDGWTHPEALVDLLPFVIVALVLSPWVWLELGAFLIDARARSAAPDFEPASWPHDLRCPRCGLRYPSRFWFVHQTGGAVCRRCVPEAEHANPLES